MKEKIKGALDEIKVDEEEKKKVKKILYKRAEEKTKINLKKLVLVPTCLILFIMLSLYFVSYTTEVYAISIDINSSIELQINKYNKVINTKSYNLEGKQLLEEVKLKNLDYETAIDKVINSNKAKKYTKNGNIIVVTVDGKDNNKVDNVLKNIENNQENNENVYCYKGNYENHQEAHSHNMSFGKYNAYLELKKYDENIDLEEVKKMTMKEIKNLINSYNGIEELEETHEGCHGKGKKHNCNDDN